MRGFDYSTRAGHPGADPGISGGLQMRNCNPVGIRSRHEVYETHHSLAGGFVSGYFCDANCGPPWLQNAYATRAARQVLSPRDRLSAGSVRR